MKRILFVLLVVFLHDPVISQDPPIEVIKDFKRECIQAVGAKTCTQKMDLNKRSKNKKSAYDLSDNLDSVSTDKAWDAVMKNKVYKGEPGKDVDITITPKGNQMFQMQSLKLFAQNSELVVVKPFVVYTGGFGREQVYQKLVRIKETDGFTEITAYKTNATYIEITFVLDKKKLSKGILVKDLQLKACKQEGDVNREDAPLSFDKKTFTTTPNRCLNLFTSTDDPQFFKIDANGKSKDTSLMLSRSKSSPWFEGEAGKDIEMTITTKDGGDFEWWKICMSTSMVREVEFTLYAKGATFRQTKPVCDCQTTAFVCFTPWDRDITVTKATVKIRPCKNSNSPAKIRRVAMSGCRDHWHHNYILHTNPGDYRILTINSVRNETLTLYGAKDTCGNMVQSEMLHYTDHTGNIGDKITILIGEDSLVSKIINTHDTISFKWILNKNIVLISIVSANGRFKSDVRLDLKNQIVLTPDLKADTKKRRRRRATCPDKQAHLHVLVKECKALKPEAFVFAYVTPLDKKTPKIKVFGRKTSRIGMYDIMLPKAEAAANVKGKICDSIIKTQKVECERYGFITRERYRFICKQMRSMLDKFTVISRVSVERARLHEVCDMTFLATNALCRATTDSSEPGKSSFLAGACKLGQNIKDVDLHKQLGNRIKASFFYRNLDGKVFIGKKNTDKEIVLNDIPFFLTTISTNDVAINVFSVPEIPNVLDGYQLSVHYNCLPEKDTIDVVTVSNVFRRESKLVCKSNECSCCNNIIDGAKENQLVSFDGEKIMDNLRITHFQGNLDLSKIDYFVQIR